MDRRHHFGQHGGRGADRAVEHDLAGFGQTVVGGNFLIHRQGAAFNNDLPGPLMSCKMPSITASRAPIVGQRRDQHVRIGRDLRDRGRRVEADVIQGRNAIGVQGRSPNTLNCLPSKSLSDIAPHGAEADNADGVGHDVDFLL